MHSTPGNLAAFTTPPAHREFIEEVDFLCFHCPKGRHREQCPFKMLAGVSRRHRMLILEAMDQGQFIELFDLAGPCRCPIDPREPTAARRNCAAE